MKVLGFKNVLVLATLLLVFTSLLFSNWLSYIQLRDNSIARIDERASEAVNNQGKSIEYWFQAKIHAIDVLVENYNLGMATKDYVPALDIVQQMSELATVMFGFNDGRAYAGEVIDSVDWEGGMAKPGTYDSRTRPWFQLAKKSKGLALTDIYLDSTSGAPVISIVKDLGDMVVVGDITLSILKTTLDNIPFSDAVATIIDDQGVVIASNTLDLPVNARLRDKGMADLQSRMLLQAHSKLDHMLNGVDKIFYSQEVKLVSGRKWYLLVGIDKSSAYAAIDEALSTAIISSIIMLVIAAALVITLLNTLYRPILTLKELVLDISKGNGDLTRRLPVTRDDDLGQISAGINLFVADIQGLMLKVSQASVYISENVEQLTGHTTTNNHVLAQHSLETEQIVAAIEEMSLTADNVANNAAQASQATHKTNNQVANSKLVLTDAINTIAQLVDDVDSSAVKITKIDQDTQAITQVLQIIGEIADQTNLLALNAAIEAARAGDQGRGFAVVADEVRALAGRTQASTAEISETLDKLKQGSSGAIEAMKNTKDTCDKTANSAAKVEADLNQIIDSVTGVNDLNAQIAKAAEQQSSVSQEITRNTTAIRDIVVQLSENAEVATTEITSLADSNSQLNEMVNKFKLA